MIMDEMKDKYHFHDKGSTKEINQTDCSIVHQERRINLSNYTPASPIIIATLTGIVIDGIYRKTQGNGSNILIDSVSEFPLKTRCAQQVPVCYSAHEIKYLHVFDREDHCLHDYNETCPALIGISYEEFLKARDLIWDSKYIPVYDCNFQNTLQEIHSFSVIGIVAVGSHSDKVRYAQISIFVVATRNNVYLFDIMFTPKYFWEMGLKNILEDKRIQKVLYDSKTVADLLLNRYQIRITNVFDVMVADYEICKRMNQNDNNKEFKIFPALIETYLNLPGSILEYSELIVRSISHKNRPLADKVKQALSLAAVFLIPLRETQAALLLQHFYKAAQVYSNSLLSGSDQMDGCEEIMTHVP